MKTPISLDRKILIAAHHYQSPNIIKRASLIGDSYNLAVEAARSKAEYIIVCGVRFMAESVAILAHKEQKILLPEAQAGCPMSDMITTKEAEKALRLITSITGKTASPLTYMNTSADIKALTGKYDGSVCTSANAAKILGRYRSKEQPVFFMPDQYLGQNTAQKLGLSEKNIALIKKDFTIEPLSKTTDFNPAEVCLFLWDGFCPVHRLFTDQDVQTAKKENPDARIIVHPECKTSVVSLAGESGSTTQMVQAIENSKPGTTWIIGTEFQFVQRMKASFPTLTILPLRTALCPDMALTTEESLDNTINSILENNMQNLITINEKNKIHAQKAMKNMVAITEETPQ